MLTSGGGVQKPLTVQKGAQAYFDRISYFILNYSLM